MFSLASKLISTIDSPAFQIAYEKGRSILDATDELHKLKRGIQTIQVVLLDAENKQESSSTVKDWTGRVRDLLYNVDDLFDEVVTDYMLNQHIIKEDKLLKKVRASCFKLNKIFSKNSIANKVKATSKSLVEISNEMKAFQFVAYPYEPISDLREGQDVWSFVDSKNIIGRHSDKRAILSLLFDDKSNDGESDVSVIAIVGIGGMGKTTLAQLVYNDTEVLDRFENRWFACISDTYDDEKIIGKIFQSVCEGTYGNFTLGHMESELRKSINKKKFLLVLDDVWDDNRTSWLRRLVLLGVGAKGSKIIVTTRSLTVARVMDALEVHNLEGLSESDSWDFFKREACFTPEKENDHRWASLGREIVKKCVNVPLAIKTVGSLLFDKPTIQEWEMINNKALSEIGLGDNSITKSLKLSYDHLPSELKYCFAYCSLIPKDYIFDEDQIIYLWIAQGYIKPNDEETIEQTGHSYFMYLLRISFFKKVKRSNEYTMNGLLHDLAHWVAREEIISLTKPLRQFKKSARHVIVGHAIEALGEGVAHKLNTSQLRSFVCLSQWSLLAIDQILTSGKCLRVLSLSNLRIKTISSSIGELKHLRNLNLSYNSFHSLPDSMTNLLNLLTLDIKKCLDLEALPDSFRKLINLRHLNITDCGELKHMPPGMGELSSLQKLSDFKVGKAIEGFKSSGLDAFATLKLKGELTISFDNDIDNWDGDECWQLPVSVKQLMIWKYPGRRIPNWSSPASLLNLANLTLKDCHKVKHLPPLRCLPDLEYLNLSGLKELEYIEDEEDADKYTKVTTDCIDKNPSFFPLLRKLQMYGLPKLKGWSRRKVAATAESLAGSGSPDLSFPLLSQLKIESCGKLTSFPLYPCLQTLVIKDVDGGLVSFSDKALSSLKSCGIFNCRNLENLYLHESPYLEHLVISDCDGLTRVKVYALPSLVFLAITRCDRLKSLSISSLSVLQEFWIWGCPEELDLWGWCVDWDSLPNLHLLYVDRFPSQGELPDFLQQLRALGQLQIRNSSIIHGDGSLLKCSSVNPLQVDNEVIRHTSVQELQGAVSKERIEKQESEINECKTDEVEDPINGPSSHEMPYTPIETLISIPDVAHPADSDAPDLEYPVAEPGQKLFTKMLTRMDMNKRLNWPSKHIHELPDFKGGHQVDFTARDMNGKVWNFCCSKRMRGPYPKTVVSAGWIPFLRSKRVRAGDEVIFFRSSEPDVNFEIHIRREIPLFGICTTIEVPALLGSEGRQEATGEVGWTSSTQYSYDIDVKVDEGASSSQVPHRDNGHRDENYPGGQPEVHYSYLELH